MVRTWAKLRFGWLDMFSFCSRGVKSRRKPNRVFRQAVRGPWPPITIVALRPLWMSGEKDLSKGRDPLARRNDGSGDDVGRDLVFDEGDAVAQLQLALF